ncbi:MAG: signal peptidase II [Planctomycetes bacterium]|nr:signal peptidase II [Planctomycetota bacterium]
MRLNGGRGLFIALALAATVVDLATKRAIFDRLGMPGAGDRLVLLPGVFVLETNLNEGALFGMGQGLGWLFAAISITALAGIVAMVSRPSTLRNTWLLVAMALICGGIVGNLYDRLGLPGLSWHAPLERMGEPVRAVRDWIHVAVPGVIDWPIFNLADSWLVIGAGMLLLTSLGPSAAKADRPVKPAQPDRGGSAAP